MSIPFEKILTPGVRAGNTVERIAKLAEVNVCPEAIAAQISHNSQTGTKYTENDIETIVKVYKDCQSKVLISKKQAEALYNDAIDSSFDIVLA